MKQMVLIAAAMLSGGIRAKDGSVTPAELNAGEELTDAKAAALGLNAKDIETLLKQGSLIEVSAIAATAVGAEELAAMKARLEKAEGDARGMDSQVSALSEENAQLKGQVADLTAKLAEATKPAK